MERRPTSILTTLTVSVLALTLIAPWGCGQDPDLISEIRRQAEQGNADAQNNLGVMYGEGSRVPQDHAEAVRWFRMAAEQGHGVEGPCGTGNCTFSQAKRRMAMIGMNL